MTDISFLAEVAYATGISPIDYAVTNVIRSHVEMFLATRDIHADFRREVGHPLSSPEPTTDTLSRQILADLLRAGWVPPEVTK